MVGRTVQSASGCNSTFAFAFLVIVAISKTVLTKHIFEDVRAPVALSAISCAVTAILLMPISLYTKQMRMLRADEIGTFVLICTTVAADLAFTNIALSILPLAFQQAIKSTLPVVTITLDFLINRTRTSLSVLSVVIGICIGPVIMSLDKDWSVESETFYGTVMLTFSILAGALKYVLAHAAIKRYKEDMGVLGFTFWMEVVAFIVLLPWSIVNGDVTTVWASGANWALLIGNGAFGGVRIISQFLFLERTSATSLATSNLAILVGLTLAGTIFFHDRVTVYLVLGSTVTLVMSASYTYLKQTEGMRYDAVKESS